MATNLHLEEQEQLDRLKRFWERFGAPISWLLALALLAWAGWTGWQWWQRSEADKAAGMFVELEQVARSNDVQRTATWFSELQQRHPRTLYAAQAGLLAAKVQLDNGQAETAQASLRWVADHAADPSYQAIARLRLAGLALDAGKLDEALQWLGASWPPGFEALADDRRGDVLLAQGKREEALAAYRRAHAALDDQLDLRRLVEAKLTSLGALAASAAGASAAAQAGSAAAAASAPAAASEAAK